MRHIIIAVKPIEKEEGKITMDHVVKEWIIENIKEQIEDYEGTIANEKLWLLGSTSAEEIQGHAENLKQLYEALNYYHTQLRDVMAR